MAKHWIEMNFVTMKVIQFILLGFKASMFAQNVIADSLRELIEFKG